jgi:hypothetical protein
MNWNRMHLEVRGYYLVLNQLQQVKGNSMPKQGHEELPVNVPVETPVNTPTDCGNESASEYQQYKHSNKKKGQ